MILNNHAAAATKPEDKALVSAALKLLSRRDFSRSEFVSKLTSAGFDNHDVEAAADWCHEQGFLNEARFAESASRRLGAKFGVKRVAHTLRQKGVAEDQVSAAVLTLSESEQDRAGALWARKFGEVAESAEEKSKQIRYLQSRGFSFTTIKLVITGVSDAA